MYRTQGLSFITVIILVLIGFASPAFSKPVDTSSNLIAVVGEVLIVDLHAMAEMGYSWKLNKAKSRGLGLLSVEKSGKMLAKGDKSIAIRSENKFEFAIGLKNPGTAELVFDYIEPDTRRSYVSRTFKIEIGETITAVDVDRTTQSNQDITAAIPKNSKSSDIGQTDSKTSDSYTSHRVQKKAVVRKKRRAKRRQRNRNVYAIRGQYFSSD